jgi:O-antigen ligase
MNRDSKRPVLEYGIALDLVMVVSGIAFLFSPAPILLLAMYLVAVAGGAWFGGVRGGATAAAFSLLGLALMFSDNLDILHYAGFISASAVISAGVPFTRLRLARRFSIAAEPLPRVEEPQPDVALPAVEAEELEPSRLRLQDLAVPLLVVLIYWNVSDILSRNFPVPSVLQPAIVLFSAIVWKNRKRYRPAGVVFQPLAMLLFLYCIVQFVSSTWARELAFADKKIFDTIKNLFIFLLVGTMATSWATLRRGLMTIVIAAGIISSISVVQIATGKFPSGFGGLASLDFGNIYGERSDARASGPVGDPNFYGQILDMVVPVALFLAYSETRKSRRLLWLALAAAVAGGILVTYSRGAMLALAAMGGLIVLALRLPIFRVAAVVVAMLAVLIVLPSDISRRFATIQALMPSDEVAVHRDSSIERRKLMLGTVFQMFNHNLVLGVGIGNYSPNFLTYANEVGMVSRDYDPLGQFEWPHMLYFEIGAETGLVGLTTFLAAIAAAFAALWRSTKLLKARGDHMHAALSIGLGIALTSYLITSLFLHSGYQRYLYLLLAFIAALTRLAHEPAAVSEVAI